MVFCKYMMEHIIMMKHNELKVTIIIVHVHIYIHCIVLFCNDDGRKFNN